MNDLDRLLQRALKSVGESYTPADELAARERFFRRRRRRRITIYGGAVAVAGAAAAIALVVSPQETIRERPERIVPVVGPKEAVVETTIKVGAVPNGIGAGDGFVFVANTGSGTVSVVDPAAGDVVRNVAVPRRPEDVVVGYGFAWVTSEGGRLARIQTNTHEAQDLGTVGTGGHLDIAVGPNGIWLVESGEALYRVDEGTAEVERFRVGRDPTDVAALNDVVWVYDRAAGDVLRIDPLTGELLGRAFVGYANDADLRAAEGATWFYRDGDGMLLRLDPATGRPAAEFPLGGTYGAIAAEGDQIWAMVGSSRTGKGTLFHIDPDRATQIGNPLPLTDAPFDLVVANGSVWVTNGTRGTITRVGVVSEPEVADPSEDVLFYYAARGDIYSYRSEGDRVPLLDSPSNERAPSLSPERFHLAFERSEQSAPAPEVVVLDLQSGEERVLGRGLSPAFGSDGLVAAVQPEEGTSSASVEIWSHKESGAMGFALAAQASASAGAVLPHDLAWDTAANTIYLTVNHDQTALQYNELPKDPLQGGSGNQAEIAAPQADAAYIAPVGDGAGGVAVIKLCCDSRATANYESAELVVVDSGGEHRIVGLDDLGLDPGPQMFLADADGLTYDVTTGWRRRPSASWFAGDGSDLWLVYEDGRRPDAIDLPDVTGIAVIPD